MMEYEPYGKTKKILDLAMAHIKSVPYAVSVRWVFYRLLQDGIYSKKAHYPNLVTLTSRARHAFYADWHPATLADETRSLKIFDSLGSVPTPDMDTLIEEEKNEAVYTLEYYQDQLGNYEHEFVYRIDPNYYQDTFCIIMFEARAMLEQFQTYTHGLTLCPFGGQASIPYKWKIAKYIENACLKYEKGATALYFGDLDEYGLNIFNAGARDIQDWCDADVEFVHCGLNQEQVNLYNIPENLDHPGSWQWEALTDEQAKEIIEENLNPYYDISAQQRAETEASRITTTINEAVDEYLISWQGEE